METKRLIEKHLKKRGEVRAADIIKETGFSRTYINRILQDFRREGRIRLLGRANRARYVSTDPRAMGKAVAAEPAFHRMLRNVNLEEDIILRQAKNETTVFHRIPRRIERIVEYGFTEMLNNAIEHSKSKRIDVKLNRNETGISFVILDRGVGIFKNIMAKRNLSSELEAIQDLVKGKLTTAPKAHTGEGIFFTSKVADVLEIRSSRKLLTFDNRIGDVFIRNTPLRKGTQVSFRASLKSKRKLESVFRQFTGEELTFDRTSVAVKLYAIDTGFVSRSQARRLLPGLEKFHKVVLDFRDIELVGQAFIDEIFRVWKSKHPRRIIEARNANQNVQFMMDRANTGA